MPQFEEFRDYIDMLRFAELKKLGPEEFDEMIKLSEVHHNFESEIKSKVRDADTNLHRRSYVDGSF